jgi:hypothetical protein
MHGAILNVWLVVVTVLSLPGATAPAPAPTLTVTAAVTFLREEPSTAGVNLARLERGAVLELVAVSGKWYRVRTAAGEGFVHGLLVTAPRESGGAVPSENSLRVRHRAPLHELAGRPR